MCSEIPQFRYAPDRNPSKIEFKNLHSRFHSDTENLQRVTSPSALGNPSDVSVVLRYLGPVRTVHVSNTQCNVQSHEPRLLILRS